MQYRADAQPGESVVPTTFVNIVNMMNVARDDSKARCIRPNWPEAKSVGRSTHRQAAASSSAFSVGGSAAEKWQYAYQRKSAWLCARSEHQRRDRVGG